MCGHQIAVMSEKVFVESHNFHKECFRCAICEQPLVIGCCASDHVLYRYFGPIWFCHEHMMLGSGEKYELMKKKLQDRAASQQ
uniref:LIM zinc-binding domain-containing protein n=1 Tax=Ditylenchus dipsaci TaxID=166011 RepID=A0A915CN69_9BILA